MTNTRLQAASIPNVLLRDLVDCEVF